MLRLTPVCTVNQCEIIPSRSRDVIYSYIRIFRAFQEQYFNNKKTNLKIN